MCAFDIERACNLTRAEGNILHYCMKRTQNNPRISQWRLLLPHFCIQNLQKHAKKTEKKIFQPGYEMQHPNAGQNIPQSTIKKEEFYYT